MKAATPAWIEAANQPIKSPIYVIEIIGLQLNAQQVYFCTNEFSGSTGQFLPLMTEAGSMRIADVDFFDGSYSSGSYRFNLVDVDGGTVTGILRNTPLTGKESRLYVGFKEIGFSDFYLFPPAEIDSVTYSEGLYTFDAYFKDILDGGNIFRDAGTATLSEDYENPETNNTIKVTGVDNLLVGVDEFEHHDGDPYTRRIKSPNGDVISYSLLDPVTGEITITRIFQPGPSERISEGAELVQVFSLVSESRSPGENLLRVILTTAGGLNGDFDEGIQGFGAGVDKSRVDVDGILRNFSEQYLLGPIPATDLVTHARHPVMPTFFNVYSNGPEKLIPFLADTYLKLGAPVIRRVDENVSFVFPDPILDRDPVGFIDANDIFSVSMEMNDDEIKEKFVLNFPPEVQYDSRSFVASQAFNPAISGIYGAQNPGRATVSISKRKGLEISVNQSTGQFFQNVIKATAALFYRYAVFAGRKSIDYTIECDMRNIEYQEGDYISFSYPHVPNMTAGGFGVENVTGYVIGKEVTFYDEIRYKIRSFDQFGFDTSPIFTVNEIVPATQTLAWSVPLSVTNTPQYTSNAYLIFYIELTPPGSALGVDIYPSSRIQFEVFDGLQTMLDQSVNVRYHETDDNPVLFRFKLPLMVNLAVIDDVRVTYNGTANDTVPPTLKLLKIEFIDSNVSIYGGSES